MSHTLLILAWKTSAPSIERFAREDPIVLKRQPRARTTLPTIDIASIS
jgi:hypothetical protein